ncbi:MAG: hypothetical protein ACU85E_05380 [Gammaproteobacteria bacterium]
MAQEREQTVMIFGKQYTAEDLLREKDEYVRLEAADKCFALRELVNDTSVLVRMAVARKGVGHDALVADSSWKVRAVVAKYSKEERILDLLVKDVHDFVRFVLVKRCYALECFLQDSDEEIAAIARHGLDGQYAA